MRDAIKDGAGVYLEFLHAPVETQMQALEVWHKWEDMHTPLEVKQARAIGENLFIRRQEVPRVGAA